MPDLPALPLGSPERQDRVKGRSRRPKLEGPGAQSQLERLGPALDRLTVAFDAGRMSATAAPEAAPEQVLVLEVAGELTDFAKAIDKIPGLEFLVEAALERAASGEDFVVTDAEGKPSRYDRQLYLVLSDATAWRELLRLWERFQRGERMPKGKAPFGHMFSRLETLRAWDDRDRLERTGALDAWARELDELVDELVEFEVELWLRADAHRRIAAVDQLRADLVEAGGQIVDETVRTEISYHGILARVPARRLREIVDDPHHRVRWMKTGAVRFFHATGQVAVTTPEGAVLEPAPSALTAAPPPRSGDARVALLDGVPLSGHNVLAGRIVLDDPAGWESVTPANRRIHGTAMASVVVHGDLNAGGPAQRAPIYVRPILWDQAPSWVRGVGREELPRDRLPVDVLHEAIARMFEGEAVAPAVRVVVLAVGDAVCQFDRFVSPLARLLDWLQSRYEILVLVSAGNHVGDLEVPSDFELQPGDELQHEVLCALQREAGLRRLLSPAESVNALTIGAAHDDASGAPGADGRVEPMLTGDLPNVGSAVGSGVRRSVKPEILLPGGRQLLTIESSNRSARRLSLPVTRRSPGVRTAAPGTRPGELDATTHDTGTSPATGMAGYHAGHILTSLDALRARSGQSIPGPEFDAVLVKAALVHAASWGTAARYLDRVSAEVNGSKPRDVVARMVGYGRSRPGDVLNCDDHRVTALAAERIEADDAHVYRFPLPPSLASRIDRRRLTITLAWLSPINPEHRFYRRAALAVERAGMPEKLVERADVDHRAARRGTVQHDVLQGARAVPFAPGDAIELSVTCRADAGELTTAVPYAIFVTLEVPPAIGLPIYQEVRQRLRVPIPLRSP
jgi:hypothetical protein